MDKRAKDKLAGTPGENGGRQGAQKDLQSTIKIYMNKSKL